MYNSTNDSAQVSKLGTVTILNEVECIRMKMCSSWVQCKLMHPGTCHVEETNLLLSLFNENTQRIEKEESYLVGL